MSYKTGFDYSTFILVAASHQTGLDTRSMTRRPILVRIKGEGKVGHEPRLEPCWSMLLIDPLKAMWVNEPSCITNPNLGPGTDPRL